MPWLTSQALQEPLYRVETGNYEYRLILRCRQEARIRFAKLRADVLVKLELLDQKHVQDIVFQLQRLVSALAQYHTDCYEALNGTTIFPIEVDLSKSTFHYRDPSQPSPYQVSVCRTAIISSLDATGRNSYRYEYESPDQFKCISTTWTRVFHLLNSNIYLVFTRNN